MIKYSGGAHAGLIIQRGQVLRFVLGPALDWRYVLNPLDLRGFDSRANDMANEMRANSAGVAVMVSAPAVSGGGLNTNQRAVIDASILGGTDGYLTLSLWIGALDALTPGIRVIEVALVPTASATGRGAVLAQAVETVQDDSFLGKLERYIKLIRAVLIALAIIVIGVLVYTYLPKR